MPKKKKKEKNTQNCDSSHFLIESTPLKFLGKSEDGIPVETHQAFLTPGDALKEIVGVEDTFLALNMISSTGIAVTNFFPQELVDGNNIMAQSLHDMKPRDSMEARLIAQSTAVFSHAMKCLVNSDKSEYLPSKESYANMAVKFMRVLNETIETLNRYRRKGEQKVTVTHSVIAEKAIVNNFTSEDRETQKNKGETSCSQRNVEPKPEPITISHADNQQWPMGDVDSMEGKIPGQRQKRGLKE